MKTFIFIGGFLLLLATMKHIANVRPIESLLSDVNATKKLIDRNNQTEEASKKLITAQR